MALIPKTKYPLQTDPSDPGYPYGKAQNVTSPGDGNGTPWEEALVNDLFGFQQALLDKAGITPDGVPDRVGASQYVDAIPEVVEKGYPAAKPRTYLLPASCFVPDATNTDTRLVFNPAPSGGDIRLRLGSGSFAVANLAGLIPSGADNVKFALILTAGGHLADGKFYLVTKTISEAPFIGSRSVQTLGTVTAAGLQTVKHPSLFTSGWSNSGFTNELVYSTGAIDVGSYDYIEGMIVTFDDPGPRNY